MSFSRMWAHIWKHGSPFKSLRLPTKLLLVYPKNAVASLTYNSSRDFSWATFLPRISMFISDQPEERTFPCLKRRDSNMACSHCLLSSHMYIDQNHPQHYMSSSDRFTVIYLFDEGIYIIFHMLKISQSADVIGENKSK